MYIEVHILERSDPNIILNLERCWATTTPNAQSLPQWDLLVDGYIKHKDGLENFFKSTVYNFSATLVCIVDKDELSLVTDVPTMMTAT